MERLVSTTEQFWSRVDVRSENECWEWKRGFNGKGLFAYGRLRWKGKRSLSNRVAFEMAHGHPPIHNALHTCDNPKCCNPKHLYDGTDADNVHDCVRRGRHVPGSGRRKSK